MTTSMDRVETGSERAARRETTVAELTGVQFPSAGVDVVWPFTTDPAALPLAGPASAPTARGVIWTQVRGSDQCSASAASGVPCQRLAANYWSGAIAGGTVQGPNPHVAAGLGLAPWTAQQPVCLFCDGSFPSIYIGNTCLADGPCGPDATVLRSDRLEVPAAPQLSLALSKSYLQSTVTWITPSELRDTLDPDAVRMVGTTFGQIVARVTTMGNTLGLVEELAPMLPKPSPQVLTAAAAAFSATGTLNATGRGTILLGNAARVITFGGDLYERQNLDVTDLRTGLESSVYVTGERPGVVLAATHRLIADAALVLDRVPTERRRHRGECGDGDPREHVRLLSVDLRTGVSRVVGTFPWASRYDRYAMVTMSNGDTVLVASSASRAEHVAMRFRVLTGRHHDLSVQVIAETRGAGAMIAAPVASIEGVSVAVQPRGLGWTVVGYPLAVPRRRPEHDLDDCF